MCLDFQTNCVSGGGTHHACAHQLLRCLLLPPGGCWVRSFISRLLSSLHALTTWNAGENGFKKRKTPVGVAFVFLSLFDLHRECCHRLIPTIEVVRPPYVPVLPFYHATVVCFEELCFFFSSLCIVFAVPVIWKVSVRQRGSSLHDLNICSTHLQQDSSVNTNDGSSLKYV